MRTRTVSVGIPAYNEEKNIRQLLQALLKQKQAGFELIEIIVVSDQSLDRTVEEALSVHSPKIQVIEKKKRGGQAAAQNQIVSLFRGDILVLLNADVLPTDTSFLQEIVKPFENPQVGLVGPLIVPLKPRSFFEKVLFFSVMMKQALFQRWRDGNNIYACVGRARAFSRAFAKQLHWPAVTTEDAYSYLKCIQLGYEFAYCRSAIISYKLPTNLHDHVKQSARFLKGSEELQHFFPPEIVDPMYALPVWLCLVVMIEYFLRHPILFIGYVGLFSRVKIIRDKSQYLQTLWEVSDSSKTLDIS